MGVMDRRSRENNFMVHNFKLKMCQQQVNSQLYASELAMDMLNTLRVSKKPKATIRILSLCVGSAIQTGFSLIS